MRFEDAAQAPSADLTGQANHLGVTIQADIIKQKLPTHTGGYVAMNMGGSKSSFGTPIPIDGTDENRSWWVSTKTMSW